MRGSYWFLALLPLFTKSVHTAEPATMLEAVMLDCNLDESQKDKYEALPEFKACNNWTAIKSVDNFSRENINNAKCLLYHDALVSLCKRVGVNASDVSLILSTEPESMRLDKVCEYLVGKQNESLILKDMTTELCTVLCWKYEKKQLLSDALCTKSYIFFNFTKNDQQKVVSVNSKNQEPLNSSNETGNKNDLTGTENDVKSEPVVSNQTPNIEVEKKPKIDAPNELSPKENEDRLVANTKQNNSETSDKELKLKPIEDKVLDQASKANNEKIDTNLDSVPELNLKPNEGHEDKVPDQASKANNEKINTNLDSAPETLVEQGDPPNNLNTNIQSTDQGQQVYQDDDDMMYRLEKESKIANPPVETAPESIDVKEDLTRNDFKKPQVSPLSESLAYDSDLSGNSYFFSYFSFTCVVLIVGYVFYHNKQKLLALLVEGRHSRRPQRTRRPNSANYHKLDSNLEEAISSSVSKNPSHVIY